jgi:serine/threonine-protein kinase
MPVLSDGLLYCVSAEGYIYALDAQTGSEQWHFKAAGSIFVQPVVSDGLVYIASHQKSLFYALDAKTGLERWKFKAKEMNSRSKNSVFFSPFPSSPLVANGVVYFGSGHRYVFALDSKTGVEKWRFKMYDYIFVTPIIINDLIYIASVNGLIWAIDIQTGIKKWGFVSNQRGVLWSWAIANDFLYISDFGSKQLNAFDMQKIANGVACVSALRWGFSLDRHNNKFFLATADELVYHIQNHDEHAIFALDYKTGAERWKFSLRQSQSGYFTVTANEGMYVADEYSFYLLDEKTGTVLTEWKTDIAIASPFVKTENNIYFFGTDGTLTALELTPTVL